MARFTVGCVPYINAIPLVHRFERLGDASPVKVVYDAPSALPALLESGRADAILVSSYYALTQPELRFANGICIGSDGPVESVRLFSKVPWTEVRSLALDQSSMTSAALAELVFWNRFGIKPTIVSTPPDLDAALDLADACVLIGDVGMSAHRDNLRILDLGGAWTEWTGLPFIWAGWIGGERMVEPLVAELALAAQDIRRGELETIITTARAQSGWSDEVVRRYYTQTMRYEADARALDGMRRYADELGAYGFPAHFWPEIVGATSPATL